MKPLIVLLAVFLYACDVGESPDTQSSSLESVQDSPSRESSSESGEAFCAQVPVSGKAPLVVNPVLGGPCKPPKVDSPTTVIIAGPEILTWDEGNWDEEVWK